MIQRRALVAYFVLAYVLSWAMVALVPTSVVFGLLALFGPALAAVIVTWFVDGGAGVGRLFKRVVLWRVGALPYVAAVGVPLLVAVASQTANALMGVGSAGIRTENASVLTLLLGLLVVGEEIGWRGFALPRLQERFSSLVASVILGVVWACWHLANSTIPGLSHYWTGFPAFLVFVVGQTIFFTWVFNRSRGSVLLAWLVHASINISGALFTSGDIVRDWWFDGAGYVVVAVALVLAPMGLRRQEPSPAA